VDRREVLGRTFSQAVLTHPYPTVTADVDTVVCRNASLRGTFTNNRARVPRALAQGRMSLRPAGRGDLPPSHRPTPSETSAACPHYTAYGTRLSGQLRPTLDFDSLLERASTEPTPGRPPRESVMDERSPRSPG
jgi:hypothetical protein